MRNAGQLATLIKQMIKMDLAEIGENSEAQNTYIYDFMSRSMQKMARLAYITRISDPLTISADGFATFKLSAADIADMYEPLRILDSTGREVAKRNSFGAPKGWWKESANSQIHVKGLNGSHILHYIKYPKEITASSDIPEFPPSAYMGLVYDTMGMIKESKNYYDEANNMYLLARTHLKIAVKANEDARGFTGGRPPSINDVDAYYKG
jgi:hypothetical protein